MPPPGLKLEGGGEPVTENKAVQPSAAAPIGQTKGQQAARPQQESSLKSGVSGGSAREDKTRCVRGEGGGAVFPSSRPLRVFVSQGDVVYIDEVEAVAIKRGGSAPEAGTTTATASSNGNNRSGGDENTGTLEGGGGGQPNGGDKVGEPLRTGGESLLAAVNKLTNGGGGVEPSSPAFFDPLLNPGSSDERDQREGAWSSAVVLLVPLRLGLDELSASYIPSASR